MTFQSLKNNYLIGLGDPIKYDINKDDIYKDFREKKDKIHGEKNSIKLIILSALIFITLIAFFDLIRTIISNYYTKKTLSNPFYNNNKSDTKKTLIINENVYYSSLTFSIFCLIILILSLPFLLY